MSDRAIDLAHGIETVFRRIESTTMAGVPILNPALSVRVIGMRPFEAEWLCVLTTPWFMNLMLLPDVPGESTPAAGTKSTVTFPAGRFEFIQGHGGDIGAYRSCSLFSPMFEFADQEAAEATAREILALVTEEHENDAEDRDMVAIWEGRLPDPPAPAEAPPVLSRRRLFGLGDRGTADS